MIPQFLRNRTVCAIILAALNLAAYANSFSVPFIFDDYGAIVNNPGIRHLWPLEPALKGPEGMGTAGRPLINYSFAVNYAISGLEVWSYHAINLAVHITNAILLLLVLEQALRLFRPGGGHALSISFLAASVWSLNPMQTQAVTYLVIRNESLMSMFYLTAIFAHQRAVTGSVMGRITAPVACSLGMACKEVMVSAPLVLLLYSFVAAPFHAGPCRHRWIYWMACFASWGLLAVLIGTQARAATTGFSLDDITPFQYALTQSHVLLQYLSRWLWPAPLVFDYFDRLWNTSMAGAALPVLLIVSLAAWTVRGLLRRDPRALAPAFALLVLAPSSSFYPIREPAWDYRFYLPSAAVALTLSFLFHRIASRPRFLSWSAAGLLGLGLVLGVLARNADYSSERVLYQDALRKRPGNYRLHYNLALRRYLTGDRESAREHAQAAVERKQAYPAAWILIGRLDFDAGNQEAARRSFSRAIEAQFNNPDAHLQMAALESAAGNLEDVEKHLQLALAAQPSNAQALRNMGLLRLGQNRNAEALDYGDRALALNEEDAVAHRVRGEALAGLGRMDEAKTACERAVQLAPRDPESRHSLGIILARMEKWAEASVQFQSAVNLAPENPDYARDLNRAARMLKTAP